MKTLTARRLVTLALVALFLAAGLLATPGIAGASSPAAAASAPSVCTYRVQYGDTLFSIAMRYHTSVWELMRLNNLSYFGWLYAGSTIRVPCGNTDNGGSNNGSCAYRATYVADITVPDGAEVIAGAHFQKIWRVRNTGTCVWGPGHALHSMVWVGGTQMGAPSPVQINAIVYPGSEVDLVVPMVAPRLAGRYLSEWQLKVDGGPLVGVGSTNRALYVDFYVSAPFPTTATRIYFAPGTYSQIANGSSRGGEAVRYVISARQGQRMSVKLVGVAPTPASLAINGADQDLLLPSIYGRTSYDVTLPKTQDYFITVQPNTNENFEFGLQVTIY